MAWGRALAWLGGGSSLPSGRRLDARRDVAGAPDLLRVTGQRRWWGLIGLALALGVTVAALPPLWAPENRREAWRDAAAFIAAHAGPNDALLVQADYVVPALARYFRGPQPIFFPFTET
jgi:hypothetical protein